MKVYVVLIRKNAEFKGHVDGVFKEYKDASNRYKEIIEDWERRAEGDKIETCQSTNHTFYCMTNFSQEEYMEVTIVDKELDGRNP